MAPPGGGEERGSLAALSLPRPEPPSSGEERLLGRILEALPAPGGRRAGGIPRVAVGPGDDAAVFCGLDGGALLLTVDAAEEGVHFDRRLHSPEAIGRRAVAAAVSDIAAMGGRPIGTLISLVTPPAEETTAVEIAGAAGKRAAGLGAPLVGGNITAGERLGLHVTVAGAGTPGAPLVYRKGAKPGDGLFVTGELGGAALGLTLLRLRAEGTTRVFGPDEQALMVRHLDPSPRLAAGLALAGKARAGMDISDGLALDLHRLVTASGVGALVEASRLPLAGRGADALEAALFGGEDYELLVAGPEKVGTAAGAAKVPITRIGRITRASDGVRLQRGDGSIEPLPSRGWDSLARGSST